MKIYARSRQYSNVLDRFVGKDAWIKVHYKPPKDFDGELWIRVKASTGYGNYTINYITEGSLYGLSEVALMQYMQRGGIIKSKYVTVPEPIQVMSTKELYNYLWGWIERMMNGNDLL